MPLALGPPTSTSQTFSIGASYCRPDRKADGDVQALTHGLGFDRSYWSFGGPRSQDNYSQVSADAGYTTLSYDRIGTGSSTHTNPYTISQAALELAVLQALTTQLCKGTLNGSILKSSGKVLHVGRSFGSLLTNGLIAATPQHQHELHAQFLERVRWRRTSSRRMLAELWEQLRHFNVL